ncbi:MAG: RnfH family protein [Gammaproteobacteria bacterium]|nr:RnfH family protein [Gammaproteobacteria bacterium]MDH3406330.1 RnfH family protein [Gammaproteobacteria bacterium]MDH3563369.1 RnfH family protein [Gammaproteobacteria bacterium]MDH5487470.1 RnfH family protein [Gammaproteobacteria bacterium]
MKKRETWRVEVAYSSPSRQELIEVPTQPDATVEQVIRESGILKTFPEIDLSCQQVGIYGEIASLQDPVHDGDRVEIYRALLADPKEIRKRRAKPRTGRKKK